MSTTLFHPKPRPWRTVSTSCWILSNAHGPIEEALALLGDVVPAERARDADELALRVVHGDAAGDELEQEVRCRLHFPARGERARGLDGDATRVGITRRDHRRGELLELERVERRRRRRRWRCDLVRRWRFRRGPCGLLDDRRRPCRLRRDRLALGHHERLGHRYGLGSETTHRAQLQADRAREVMQCRDLAERLERVVRLELRAVRIARGDLRVREAHVLRRGRADVARKRERRREAAVRRQVERIEARRLAQEVDGEAAVAGARERRGAVAQRRDSGRAVAALDLDAREPAVPAVGLRDLGHEVAELLFGLPELAALQVLQSRRERDLVVEVLYGLHRRLVCATPLAGVEGAEPPAMNGYRFVNCGALRARFRPGFLRSLARGSRVRSPALRSAARCSASDCSSARAIPCEIAPICPLNPPPSTFTCALKRRAVFVTWNGRIASCEISSPAK